MITADKCDGCGRFIGAPASVEMSYHWTGEGPEVDEYHYCARCTARNEAALSQKPVRDVV